MSVTAQDIAKTQSIPLQYTHQILQRLRKGEIVESVRGPKGGYKLSRIPSEINLRQVLEASEGTTFEVICDSSPPYGDKCGQEHHCALSGVWRELKATIDATLEQKTVGDLVRHHDFYPGQTEETLVRIRES